MTRKADRVWARHPLSLTQNIFSTICRGKPEQSPVRQTASEVSPSWRHQSHPHTIPLMAREARPRISSRRYSGPRYGNHMERSGAEHTYATCNGPHMQGIEVVNR